MGEILRAICDASCVYSAPAFYVGRVTSAVATAAKSYGERRAVFQLKSNTFFLLMGWTQDVSVNTGQVWEQKSSPSTFLIQDMKTSKTYGNLPIQKQNGGYNLNNIVCLPHYILFEPASLVGVIQSIPVTDPAYTETTAFVTLAGIEYQMEAGRA